MKYKLIIQLVACTMSLFAGVAQAQWQTSGSNIYFNSGDVSIGTSTDLGAVLGVAGTIKSTDSKGWAIGQVVRYRRIQWNGKSEFDFLTSSDTWADIQANKATFNSNLYLSSSTNKPYLMYGAVANAFSFSDNASHYLTVNTSTGHVNIANGGGDLGYMLGVKGSFGISNGIHDLKIWINNAWFNNPAFTTVGSYSIGYANAGSTVEKIRFGYGATDPSQAGWTDQMILLSTGNVGIGTTNPTDKLTVNGTIKSKEVIVNANAGADFVFDKDYKLPPLSELGREISTLKHLPGIPSAKNMEQNGVKVGSLQVKLLQKVEELTLYVIRQQKENNALRKRVRVLEKEMKNSGKGGRDE